MNSLLDEDTEDELDDRTGRSRDREITLGTTMVLGIFFALAAYGAVLFGFGYSVGIKHAASTGGPGSTATSNAFSGFKPAPGLPVGSAAAAAIKPSSGPAVTLPDAPVPAVATVKPVPVPRPEAAAAESIPSPAPRPLPITPAVAAAVQPPSPPALVQPTTAGAFLVQVAAVSHQEDADLLVVTLKRRGYPVVIRRELQDSLIHVQIGNFATKKDADAMRQRLLGDGFNAIVK